MTTIAELFEQTPVRVAQGVEMLAGTYYNHVPEIDDLLLHTMAWRDGFAPQVEIVVFHEVQFDHRRSQVIFGVRHDGRWVMMCRNAGRELDDFHDRQVVDAQAYQDMVTYLRQELIRVGEVLEPETTPIDTEVEFIFYHHDVRLPSPHGPY